MKKTKKPRRMKPVRAWAIVDAGGRAVTDAWDMVWGRRPYASSLREGDRVVRVEIREVR